MTQDWNKALTEAVAAHERGQLVQAVGCLRGLMAQAEALGAMVPATGKAQRIYRHLVATIKQLDDEVRKKAGLGGGRESEP